MIYWWDIKTDENPIEQKEIVKLIKRGYLVDLILDHKKSEDSDQGNVYYLYVKYRSHLRPINTQRNAHKSYTSIERAVDWGKKIGFRWLILNVNYENYIEIGEEETKKNIKTKKNKITV